MWDNPMEDFSLEAIHAICNCEVTCHCYTSGSHASCTQGNGRALNGIRDESPKKSWDSMTLKHLETLFPSTTRAPNTYSRRSLDPPGNTVLEGAWSPRDGEGPKR